MNARPLRMATSKPNSGFCGPSTSSQDSSNVGPRVCKPACCGSSAEAGMLDKNYTTTNVDTSSARDVNVPVRKSPLLCIASPSCQSIHDWRIEITLAANSGKCSRIRRTMRMVDLSSLWNCRRCRSFTPGIDRGAAQHGCSSVGKQEKPVSSQQRMGLRAINVLCAVVLCSVIPLATAVHARPVIVKKRAGSNWSIRTMR